MLLHHREIALTTQVCSDAAGNAVKTLQRSCAAIQLLTADQAANFVAAAVSVICRPDKLVLAGAWT